MCVVTPQTAHTRAADGAYPLCGKLRGDSPITMLANSKVSRQKIQFPLTCTVLFLGLATVPPIKMFTENRCIAYLCKAFYNWYLYVHTYVMGSQAVIPFNHHQAIRLIHVHIQCQLHINTFLTTMFQYFSVDFEQVLHDILL